MITWKSLVTEVETLGFGKASALARLVWSCEVGKIDQHASEDLHEMIDMANERDEARAIIIEADALSETSGKRRSYEEASLSLVNIMSMGVEAMRKESLPFSTPSAVDPSEDEVRNA